MGPTRADGGQTWTDTIRSEFKNVIGNPALGATEIWDIQNSFGGWFHPVHIHLVDSKILTCNGSAAGVKNYERGPKDTVYVGENDTVRVIARFGDKSPTAPVKNVGKDMVHCHNLVHEAPSTSMIPSRPTPPFPEAARE